MSNRNTYKVGQIVTTNSGEDFVINTIYGNKTRRYNITFLSTGRTLDTGRICKVKKGIYATSDAKAWLRHYVGSIIVSNSGHEAEILEILSVRSKDGRVRRKYKIKFLETGRVIFIGAVSCFKIDHYSPYK